MTFPRFAIDWYCCYEEVSDAIGLCPKHLDSITSVVHELCEREVTKILRKWGYKAKTYMYWDINMGWFTSRMFKYTHALSPFKGIGRHACAEIRL